MTYVGQDPEGGMLLLERACTLNPNSAAAWRAASYARNCLGDTEAAVSNAERALRLSPQDPERAWMMHGIAQAHLQAGRYDEAVIWAERAVSERPTNVQLLRTWVVALALSNRVDEARRGMADALRIAPHLRLSRAADFTGPFRRAEFLTRLMDAYRIAGMPE
jgi:tetratricopeptide (TPR) repeat protein